MTEILLELEIQEPVELEIEVQDDLSIVPVPGANLDFLLFLSANFLTGERITGTHAGQLWQMSVSDDYLYVCVQTGDASTAIWKKTILFQT